MISAYGKTGENVERHGKVKVALDSTTREKLFVKPLFKSETEIVDSSDTVCGYEIHMLKKTIVDTKPLHYNVCILQWSKILFLKFMFFLKDHLVTGSFRTCYCDTGLIFANIT